MLTPGGSEPTPRHLSLCLPDNLPGSQQPSQVSLAPSPDFSDVCSSRGTPCLLAAEGLCIEERRSRSCIQLLCCSLQKGFLSLCTPMLQAVPSPCTFRPLSRWRKVVFLCQPLLRRGFRKVNTSIPKLGQLLSYAAVHLAIFLDQKKWLCFLGNGNYAFVRCHL